MTIQDHAELRALMGSAKQNSPEKRKKIEDYLNQIREERGELGVQAYLMEVFGF